ncbi:hypothetical protein ACF0H5_014527 [Mactra antiquata]
MKTDVAVMDYEDSSVKMNTQVITERPMAVPQLTTDAERSLNFTTSPGDDFDLTFVKKPKTVRDPLSHRIIEKRRRDRMNNCLADLSRLIPSNYLKQGQGRIEKTEIIEMAIRHIKNLTNVISKQGALKSSLPDRYLGFKECQDEVMRFLVEVEGWDAHDQLCSRMMNHLEHAGEKFRIMNDESLSQDAKEEQYRHVEEDISSIHETVPIEPGGAEPPPFIVNGNPEIMPQFQQKKMLNPAQIGPQTVVAASQEAPNQQPKPFPGFESLACAQQIAQEHLKRDKHLWTLLTTKFNSKYGVDDSGLSSGHGSNVSNGESKFSPHDSDVNKPPQETTSGLIHASSQTSMDTSIDKSDSSVYKFKHSITKRFSEESSPKILTPSYISSSSSRECPKRVEKTKRKFRHNRSRSPSSTVSSQYPNSDSSNNNGSSNGETSVSTEDIKPSCLLPGFVLHPVGTHYIPMSIHPSSVGADFFTKVTQQKLNVFHPVSIPVSFGGALLYLKSVNITELENVDSGTSLGSGSDGSNSGSTSACLSENSPISEQEGSKNT